MNAISSAVHPWAYPLLTVLLSPFAIALGREWNWTAGAASLAFLIIPTCCVGLTGNRKASSWTALVAAISCLVELAWASAPLTSGVAPVYPILACCILLGMSEAIVSVNEMLHRKLERLGRQTSDYLRHLYERERQSQIQAQRAAEHADLGSAESPAEVAHPDLGDLIPHPVEDDPLDSPVVLLMLQEIARRVALNLDLDHLIPTILGTAKALFKCGHCQVYLWIPQTRTLRNASPSRSFLDSTYVPHPEKGVGGWVLKNRHVLTRTEVLNDFSLHAILEEEAELPDAAAPLTVGGELLGMMVMHKVEHDSPNFVRLLYILANISALGIKNAQLFRRIEEMARHDGLTGLLNHASFQERLEQLTHEAGEPRPLTVIMADIDHFKSFNDAHGHQAGDHVLREVARLWQAVIPGYAILARYGGEEFICALPGDDLAHGGKLAEAMRSTLAGFPFDFEGHQLNVTSSFGVAEFGSPALSATDVVRLADGALYRAKKSGRNQVCLDPASCVPAAFFACADQSRS